MKWEKKSFSQFRYFCCDIRSGRFFVFVANVLYRVDLWYCQECFQYLEKGIQIFHLHNHYRKIGWVGNRFFLLSISYFCMKRRPCVWILFGFARGSGGSRCNRRPTQSNPNLGTSRTCLRSVQYLWLDHRVIATPIRVDVPLREWKKYIRLLFYWRYQNLSAN